MTNNSLSPLNLPTALRSRLSINPRQSPRGTYIGASEVGLCLRSVIAGKHVQPDLDTASMGRMLAGRALENEVIQIVRAGFGSRFRDTGRVQREYVHPTLPFRAHPDGRITGEGDDGILEVKTASTATFKRYQSDGLPQHYQDQVQAQMGLAGLHWGLVVLVSRENLAELVSIPVTYDADHYRQLEERAERAMPFLKDQVCLPDGEPDRGFCFNCPFAADCPQHQALRRAGERGEVPEVTRLQLECQMEELTALERELDPLQQRTTELREQIRDTLAGYSINRILLEGGVLQMVASTRTSFDSKAFQRDAPDLYARYLKTATFTNLRVTATKGAITCQPMAS